MPRKAAALLIVLGEEVSAQLLKQLDDDEIQLLSREMARVKSIKEEEVDTILEEFYEMSVARSYVTKGGLDYARKVALPHGDSRRSRRARCAPVDGPSRRRSVPVLQSRSASLPRSSAFLMIAPSGACRFPERRVHHRLQAGEAGLRIRKVEAHDPPSALLEAARSPAACAAISVPKLSGHPGIGRSRLGSRGDLQEDPESGPPLCSCPVECRKRGPMPRVVASPRRRAPGPQAAAAARWSQDRPGR